MSFSKQDIKGAYLWLTGALGLAAAWIVPRNLNFFQSEPLFGLFLGVAVFQLSIILGYYSREIIFGDADFGGENE